MADTGVAVVGAGVVGLAVAARLAPRAPGLVILERRDRHGQETSSRNSEVIHAGFYYPEGSWKARLCVEGNRRLYELCERFEVPHRRCGKLLTAVEPAELAALDELPERGARNGVPLQRLSALEAKALEPHVASVGALLSPSTGVVSAHALMDALLHEALRHGATLQTRAELVALEREGADWKLTLRTPLGEESFTAERVVNAAGLEADRVAALAGIDVDAAGYRQHWCKGSYFAVAPAKARLVSRLVYPVPSHVSLGVHAVIDVGGARLRFGPDAEYFEQRREDYRVDEGKRAAFAKAVARLVPAIRAEDLSPDMAGIRPKLQAPGAAVRDFVIAEESARGAAGLVDLIGIDSPGLTSAPAIAERVFELIG